MDIPKKRKLGVSSEDLTDNPRKKRKISTSGDSLSLKSSGTISNLVDFKNLPPARFCTLNETKEADKNTAPIIKVQWDAQKLHSCLTAEEIADQLLLSNIVTGHILNGRLWPILLDSSPDPLVQKRTLAFMESLASDWSIFQTLTEQEVLFLLVGVRDLWLADSRGLLNTNEKSTLNTILDQLEDDLVPSAEHQSLNFSFCPTKNRRVFKLISHLEEKSEIDSVLLQSVAQMKIKMDDGEEIDEFLYAVWVDPRDLSYHNFEFILPLDRALKRKSNGENDTLDFKMTGVKSLAKKMRILSGNLSGADTDLLLQLDKLGLYQKPANSSTRGGERFVFSSSALAHGLTRAIKQSDVLDKLSMKMKFQFVNYVFRCNKFSPSDAKFDMHLDTPYYDKTRRHISAHTMIIYLSSGSGESILKVLDNGKKNRKEISVNKVGALEFIIFNQQYEHEGRPFIDNDKIFLRTELIFEYEPKTLVHKPEVSKIFSSAIYMTLESAFQPALSKYAHQLYEKVNAVHWGLEQESDPPKVLHKCWAEQIHFASNGSDYWFPFTQPKSDSKPSNKNPLSSPEGFIKIAAIIAVLDYLNANVKQNTENDREGKKRKRKKKTPSEPLVFETFRSNCQVLEISPPPNDSSSARNTSDWILKHLWSSIGDMIIGSGAENYSVLPMGSNPKQIFEAELSDYVNPLKADDSGEENEEKSDSESYCCPFHNYDREFEARTNITVYERYEEIVEYGIGLLYESLLFIYDKKIYLDEDSITIDGDKIFVGTSELLPVVNFASCWPEGVDIFLDVNKEIPAPKLLVPPISFVMIEANEKTGTGPGIRLMMDFFKNDWIMPAAEDISRISRVPNMEGKGWVEWRPYLNDM